MIEKRRRRVMPLSEVSPAAIIPSMKRFLSLFLVFSLFLLTLAAGEYVVSTEHFDFIYSEETEESAAEIISVAETYYSDLVSFFSVDPELHIPVYFKADAKDYNAYYTAYSSSHIIMYVTNNPLSLLSNAENPFTLTFYHELTHAFTCSIKSPVVKFFSSIFGDAFIPGNLLLNQALTEGIAVYMESRYGEGRLNSPSSLYIVNQTALEKTSLQWHDITGGRDITPSGSLPYVVGGRFLEYLSDKYGEEKLSEFITECCLFPLFNTTGSIFRRIFGVKITAAWEDFLSSLTVPADTEEAENISGWGGWSNLTIGNGRLYALDSTSSGLYEINGTSVEKLRTVTSSSSTLSFSFSFMLTDYVGSTERSVILERTDGTKVGEYEDYFTGVLLSDGEALLVTEEDRDYRMDLVALPDGSVISSFSLGRNITMGTGSALTEKEAVFVISESGKYGFLYVNTETGEVDIISAAEDLTLSSVSLSDDGTLAFPYAISDDTSSFMKYGELRREDGKWYYSLSSNEFDGGVYFPVKKEGMVWFVSSYFSGKKISILPYSSLSSGNETEASVVVFVPSENDGDVSLGGRTYNPLIYMKKGLLLPLGDSSGTLLGSSSGLGVTYITIDPTESHTLSFSSGWDYDTSSVFMSLGYKWKSFFSTSFVSTYRDGIVNAEIDFSGSYKWYLSSDTRYVGIADEVSLAYMNHDGAFLNTFSVLYSSSHSAGKGRHENAGWGAKLTVENLSPSLELAVLVPRLLPLQSTPAMSYNLPLTLRLKIGNVEAPVITAKAGVYLFTYEIQRSVSFMCMYLRNVDLLLSYSGTLATDSMAYTDTYSLSVSLGFSPLIGYLTRLSMNLDAGVTYSRDGGFRFTVSFNNGVL
jgi:hypothetical protein